MADVSSIVNIDIRVDNGGVLRDGFNTLLVLTSEGNSLTPQDPLHTYRNPAEVSEDFGDIPNIMDVANTYFSQVPTPQILKIGHRTAGRTNSFWRGGRVSSATLRATNADIVVDGVEGSVTIPPTPFQSAATALRTGLVAANPLFRQVNVQYNSTLRAFTLTSTTSGGSVRVPDQAIGGWGHFNFAPDDNGAEIGGTTNEEGDDYIRALDTLRDLDPQWYGLVLSDKITDLAQLVNPTGNNDPTLVRVAKWVEANKKVFFNSVHSNRALLRLRPESVLDLATILKNLNLSRTISTYSPESGSATSVAIAGKAFTTNFSQPEGTITLKFQSLAGVPVVDLTSTEKTILNAKNCNVLFPVGGKPIYAEGEMADGSFFDVLHGVDWLRNAIQTDIFNYLIGRGTKVPYTDKGIAELEHKLIQVLEEARANGLIAQGYLPDGSALVRGYKTTTVPVREVPADRVYRGLSFTAIGAGAIHGVQVNGKFE